jgi:hypothetical protein
VGCGNEADFRRPADPLDAVAKEFGTLPADVRAACEPASVASTCVHTMSAGASVMLLRDCCTRSTLARPESGPAGWIDDDRDGRTVQVVLVRRVQSGARRRGNYGILGNRGNVVSVSYRIYRR